MHVPVRFDVLVRSRWLTWRLVTSVANKMAADSSTKRRLSFSSFSWKISVLRRYFYI